MSRLFRQSSAIAAVSIVGFLSTVSAAHAAGTGMPWEQPLNQILQSVEGPVAKILSCHHHHHDGIDARVRRHIRWFRRLVQIVFGLSIAFAASSFFLSFFSFGGGALI